MDRLNERFKTILGRMLTTLEQKVDPHHTALIVIDMQNDFCADGGYLHKEGADMSLNQAMAPRLANFIEEARKAKLPIIYIQSIYVSENNWYLSDVWLEQHRRVGRGKYTEYPVLEEGSWGVEFYKGVKPLPGEVVVTKHRFDAFVGTDLELILKSKGIRTIILTGGNTNCCVESTARTGFVMDYYVVIPRDCVSATTLEKHDNALKIIDFYFGQVTDSSDIIKCWQK